MAAAVRLKRAAYWRKHASTASGALRAQFILNARNALKGL